MSMYAQPLLAFMEGLGGSEVFLIMVVILVLFGGEKLPEFARGAGKLIREFKKASSGVEEEFKRAMEEDERKKSLIAPVSPPVPLSAPVVPAIEAPASPMLGSDVSSEPAISTPLSAPAAEPVAENIVPPLSPSPAPTPAPSLKPPSPPKMLPGEDLS